MGFGHPLRNPSESPLGKGRDLECVLFALRKERPKLAWPFSLDSGAIRPHGLPVHPHPDPLPSRDVCTTLRSVIQCFHRFPAIGIWRLRHAS